MKKNHKIAIIISLTVALILIIGASYAALNFDVLIQGKKESKISSCKLNLNFKDENAISLINTSPINDNEITSYQPYKFTITNNSTCNTAYYKITLKDICTTCTKTNNICTINGEQLNCSSNYKISPSKIKYQLVNKKTNETITNVNPESIEVTGSLAKNEAINFELKLWIDKTATKEDLYVYENGKPKENADGSIITKNTGYKLNVEGQDNEFSTLLTLTGAELLITKSGTGGLEQVVHPADASLQIGATEDLVEYRYRGATPNNYVRFNNELWRIIGVSPTDDGTGNIENRIKIIRNEYIDRYPWSVSETTYLWENASLNTYLNGEYYNSLTSDSKAMIGNTKYYLGSTLTNGGASTYYQAERKSDGNRNHVNKIAVMYISDYGYAAANSCTAALNSYNSCSSINWLSNSGGWTIASGYGEGVGCNWAFQIRDGYLYFDDEGDGGPCINFSVASVPVLSLLSSVKITGGSGTQSDPYTLSN